MKKLTFYMKDSNGCSKRQKIRKDQTCCLLILNLDQSKMRQQVKIVQLFNFYQKISASTFIQLLKRTMINHRSQYPMVSCFFLLLLTFTCCVNGRFLQSGSSNSTSNLRPYNSTLPCGECLLGGYIYCVQGPESYDGSLAMRGVCCASNTSCDQIGNTLWNCSSKYNNPVDKFRVCPFPKNQCGNSPNLSLEGLGDSECLKVRNLSRGNACLYTVKSQCGVPNFQLNDTTSNVVIQTRMISNTPVIDQATTTGPAQCFIPTNQTCLCSNVTFLNGTQNATQLQCDCPSYSNLRLNNSNCSCQTLRDSAGNTIQQCNCSMPRPVQVLQENSCKCQKASSTSSVDSLLTCECGLKAGTYPFKNVTSQVSKCECFNNYDPVNKQSYLDCKCQDIAQCMDPNTFMKVPDTLVCPTVNNNRDFPCQCAKITVGSQSSLSCNCTNNEVRMTGRGMQLNNNCTCQPVINGSSWYQQCRCCVNENLQKKYFTPPIQCYGQDLMENCSCVNLTVNGVMVNTCNCTHPANNFTYQAAINQNWCQFPVDMTTEQKPGNCCVSYDIQAIQLQPLCVNKSVSESCKCLNISNPVTRQWQYNCTCDHPVSRVSAPRLMLNNPECYCHPTLSTMKDCNCCVSEPVVIQQLQPVCTNFAQTQNCSCSNLTINGRLQFNCSCTHNQTRVVVPSLIHDEGRCYCTPSNFFNRACNCCVGVEAQIIQQQPNCTFPTQQQNCSCSNNLTCRCTHPTTVITAPDYAFLNQSSCFCNPMSNSACNCCAPWSVQFFQLQPQCSQGQQYQNCTCRNISGNNNATQNCSCQHTSTQVVVNNITTPVPQCYCNDTILGVRACNCCMNADVQLIQLQPQCTITQQKQNCSCVTVNGARVCGCTSPQTNVTVGNLQYSNSNCYCNDAFSGLSKPCNCCVGQSVIFEQNQPVCEFLSERQPCQCSNVTLPNGRLNCSCSNPTYFNVSVSNVTVAPTQCSCNITNLAGTNLRACNCCTPYEFIRIQRQPICDSTSQTQKCQCLADSNGVQSCLCTHPANSVSSPQVNITNQYCYCDLVTGLYRPCNCCVSADVQVQQLQPICNQWQYMQGCQCSNITVNNRTSLSCNCTNPRSNRVATNVTLTNQCYCGNNNRPCNCCVGDDVIFTQSQPNCSNIQQLQNCSCGQVNATLSGVRGNFDCNCIHPQTNVSVSKIDFADNNLCYFNITQSRNGYCCANQQTQLIQLQPQCINNATGQNCQCMNVTNGTSWYLNCSCAHNDNKVVASNLTMVNRQCYCENTLSGVSKACNCCVEFKVQVAQLQPRCSVGGQTQNCSCNNVTRGNFWAIDCQCAHILNNMTASISSQDPRQCYCTNNFFGQKVCNCCIPFEVQLQQLQPMCASQAQSQKCNCSFNSTNGTNMCDCRHPLNQVFARNITYRNNNSCYCNSTLDSNLPCNCCVSFDTQVAQLQPICKDEEQKQGCQCNNMTNGIVNYLNCSCNHQLNNVSYSPVMPSSSQCYCNNTMLGNKFCNCCVNDWVEYQQLKPICSTPSFTSENCSCSNSTAAGRAACNCTFQKSGFQFVDMGINSNQCYCPTQSALNKSCACCVSETTQTTSNQFRCSNTEKIDCSCLNQTINSTHYNYSCNCTNKYFLNTTSTNVPVNNQSCYCQNPRGPNAVSPCTCCLTALQLAVKPVCTTDQVKSDCNCRTLDLSTGSTVSQCNCKSNQFGYPLQLSEVLQNKKNCMCVDNLRSNFDDCECCTVSNIWQVARPVCSEGINLQSCACTNVTTDNKTWNYRCNCTSNKYSNKSMPLKNVNITNQKCGCNAANGNNPIRICDCCVDPQIQDQAFLDNQTCSANQGKSDCQCASTAFQRLTCDCLHQSKLRYPLINVNQTSCNCLNASFFGTSQCKCCMPNKIDAPPASCPSTFATHTCDCLPTLDLGSSRTIQNCNCTSKNNTALKSTQVFNSSNSCNCLNYQNNSITAQSCECCVQNPLQCQAIPQAKIENCSCVNQTNVLARTWFYNCSCLRNDTDVFGNFPIDKSGCYCENSKCQCCVSPVQYATQVPILTCPANTTIDRQNCSCQNVTNSTNGKWSWNCNCLRKEKNLTVGFPFANNLCLCNKTNFNNCTCCIAKEQLNQQVCPRDSIQQQTCDCKAINSSKLDCNCTRADNLITKNFTFNQTLCDYNNVTQRYNCCMNSTQVASQFPVLACQVAQRKQLCSCSYKDKDPRCNCTRDDTGITKNFTFPAENCLSNNTQSGFYNCCMTQQQYDTIIPVLTCPVSASNVQNCSCRNITAVLPNGTVINNAFDCNCTRPDNNFTKNFNLGRELCLCNTTGCSCCISQPQVDSQWPVLTCDAGLQKQVCGCQTYFNQTNRQNNFNCSCTKPENGYSANFTYNNASSCLCTPANSTNCTCCVTGQQQGSQWPALTCKPETQQKDCSCVYNGYFWWCDQCKATYQNKNLTLEGLSHDKSQCLCNSTSCQCCVTNQQIEEGTEKYCGGRVLKSQCQCTNTTNQTTKNMNYQCNCSTKATNVFLQPLVSNISYNDNDGSNCICRNPSNCTCCINQEAIVPQMPQCSNPSFSPLPNCACAQNTTSTKFCKCQNITGNYTYDYGLNLTNQQCGCQNYTVAGINYQNCSCCAPNAMIAPPNPKQCVPGNDSSFQQCSCRNNTGFQICNCSYSPQNTQILNLPLIQDQCGCETTNNPSKNCSCCVNIWHYRNSLIPASCPSDKPQSNCTCQPMAGDQLNCSCTQQQSNNVIFQNWNQPKANQCGCWNEKGQNYLNCSCCVSMDEMAFIKYPTCSVNETIAMGLCNDAQSNQTKAWSKVCNVTTRSSSILSFQHDNSTVTPNSCNCVNTTYKYRGNWYSEQQCFCCRDNSTFVPQAPQCNLANSSVQPCECSASFDSFTNSWSYNCNCTEKQSTGLTLSNMNVNIAQNKCNCVNTTIGSRNYLNCSCCAPMRPPTFCQQVSIRNATNLQCTTCNNITSGNNKGQLKCDCNAPVNSTTLLFRKNMILNSTQCCCASQIDPLSRKSYYTCNCAQTPVPQDQKCNCSVTSMNSNFFNCSCEDCNRRQQWNIIPTQKCVCPSLTGTIRSNCSCSIDFNGICPLIPPALSVLDENTCEASNKPKILNITASNGTLCGNQYEYLVAVVNTGKDSNVLLNMQSYQLTSTYLKQAMTTAFLAVFALLLIAY